MSPAAPVLAVDPGRAKCGLAVVRARGEVCHREIVDVAALGERCRRLQAQYGIEVFVVGSQTAAAAVRAALRAACPEVPIATVDERLTSQAARSRYLDDHPPRGWRRLVPRGLRFPAEPYDDYAAVVLAERYWASLGSDPDQTAAELPD